MADHRRHALPAADAEGGLSVLDIWQTLRRNRWLVAGVTAGAVALGALYTWRQTPLFASGASVIIQEKQPGISLMADLGPLAGGGGARGIETDIVVMQSRMIAESVADSLALHVELAKPAVPRSELLEVVHAPRTLRRRTYTLTRQGDGTYRATGPEQPAVTVRVGQPARLGQTTIILKPAVARRAPEEIVVRVHPFRGAVAGLRRSMTVSRGSREVTVVNVGYSNTDPELAAAVPNAAAAFFIRHKAGAESRESQSMVDFLRSQVTAYENQLRAAEGELRDFREAARVVAPKDEATEQVKQLALRTADRDAKRAQRDALDGLLQRVTSTQTESGRSP
ncbi:MAG TPA: Wzz/FepE/Etk N-terminal domain-containing protein [Longimicrobium sp.]|nr:Wzz/FepE/Etk N-terminal domain-containing protein [Longimicrobium sp.]